MTIKILHADDAAAFQTLRLKALQESPTAFGSSLAEEAGRTPAQVASAIEANSEDESCFFGAFTDEQELVGILGLRRESGEKTRHVGYLRSMYVAPHFRRGGFGRMLLDEAIAHAATAGLRHLKLVVTASNNIARSLYESRGFARFGTDPDALYIAGRYYDEDYYVLRLSQPA